MSNVFEGSWFISTSAAFKVFFIIASLITIFCFIVKYNRKRYIGIIKSDKKYDVKNDSIYLINLIVDLMRLILSLLVFVFYRNRASYNLVLLVLVCLPAFFDVYYERYGMIEKKREKVLEPERIKE